MLSRRRFLGISAAMGASSLLPWRFGLGTAKAANNSGFLTKWIQPLRGLTALGDANGIPCLTPQADPVFPGTHFYNIVAGEFLDQLHPELPNPTRLWGYWEANNPIARHLGGVILANRGTPARLRFTNTLPPQAIIPVDTTIPGANQAQNRIAVHLHGGFIPWISDGGPFDWFAPDGTSGLSFLNGPGGVYDNILGMPMLPGQADFYYGNDQSTRLMWYHDHAHGITRTNAYAGLATGYLILDAANDTLAAANKIPGLGSTLPLIFQDKVFVSASTPVTDPTWAMVARADCQVEGSLWYEHVYNPKEFRLLRSRKYLPPPNPSAVPEFFGDTMLANGTVFPLLTVEAKRYRFLVLNACNARFLNINTYIANPANPDGIDLDPRVLQPLNPPGPNIIQIGAEGGFLPAEAVHVSPKPFNPATFTGNLLLGPAERADVIVDFTGMAGQEVILYNDAPGPFPAGPPTTDYFLGNPKNPIQPLPGTGPDTRQILRIKVVPAVVADPQPAGPILDPTFMDPPPIVPFVVPAPGTPVAPMAPPPGTTLRDLTLNEDFDIYGRLRQLLGTTTIGPLGGFGREYLEPATEVIRAGTTEVWRIFNLSADTHPIHFHLVNVQVLSRQPFRVVNGMFTPVGAARGPELNELGWKETVQMHPGEVTSVIMRFDLPPAPAGVTIPTSPRFAPALPGSTKTHEYVWHCHILEHEEHDMMRPLVVEE